MNTMTRTDTLAAQSLIKGLCDGNFWISRDRAEGLRPYGGGELSSLESTINEIMDSPEELSELVTPQGMQPKSGRALVWHAIQIMSKAAGYRAHLMLAKAKIESTSNNEIVKAEVARYREWATGREPDFDQMLAVTLEERRRIEYSRMVKEGASSEARLVFLLSGNRMVSDLERACHGFDHALMLSTFLMANGQEKPPIEGHLLNSARAKLTILNEMTLGKLTYLQAYALEA